MHYAKRRIAYLSVSTASLFLAAKAHSQTLSCRHALEIDSGIDKIHIYILNCDVGHFFLALTKITLFYLYFMAIFMLSHLFSSYFILNELHFNPILPEKENSPSILFVFYLYFKPIFKQVRKEWYILFLFSQNILRKSMLSRLF